MSDFEKDINRDNNPDFSRATTSRRNRAAGLVVGETAVLVGSGEAFISGHEIVAGVIFTLGHLATYYLGRRADQQFDGDIRAAEATEAERISQLRSLGVGTSQSDRE